MEDQNKTNGTATAGFVLSIVGLHIIGLILSILGLKKSKEVNKGKGLSIAGIIISSIGIFFVIIVTVFFLVGYASYKNTSSTISTVKVKAVLVDYKNLKSQVEEKNLMESYGDEALVSCSYDCSSKYYYNDDNYDVSVSDMGSYYELKVSLKQRLSDVSLVGQCDNIDGSCTSSTITGAIYKK